MLIVNADDYGMQQDVNRAIARCFEQGICTSTTIMPNMPGFREACALAGERKFRENVGMHLVLNEGRPVTGEILAFRKFCTEDGGFSFSRTSPVFSLESGERHALAAEIRGQILRCRKHGVEISHIDSHHHVHTEWGVLGVLIPVAREERIPYIRISRNLARSTDPFRRIYKSLYNAMLRFRKMSATDYFGSFDEYLRFRNGHDMAGRLTEIMIHPRYLGGEIYVGDSVRLDDYVRRMKGPLEREGTTSFHALQARRRA